MLPLHQSPTAKQQLRGIYLSAQGGSRTRKTTVLSRVPMPIRLLGHMVRTEGLEPSRTGHMILSHGCLPFHHVRLFIVAIKWPFNSDYQHFLRSLTSQLRSLPQAVVASPDRLLSGILSKPLVGRVGIEPTVYQSCLIYSQVPSPAKHTDPY